MKTRLVLVCVSVLILLAGIMINVVNADSPFPPWVSQLTAQELPTGSNGQTGQFIKKQARFIYDVAAHGGSVGARTLGVFLPGSAVVTRSYLQVLTPFTSGASGGGTVALSCEDANNIKTATDLSGSSVNAFVEGQSTGATSAFVRDIAAPCNITATVASTAQTAGKLVGWIDFIIAQ